MNQFLLSLAQLSLHLFLPSYSSKYEIIKNSEKNNRNEAHDDEVSKLEEIN